MTDTAPASRRDDFPLLAGASSLTYLDSAATTQKPAVVIEAERHFYQTAYANPHRGLYDLAILATDQYENVRDVVATFSGASSQEIIFTANATHALNLSAYLAGQQLQTGDEIVLSVANHHSVVLPWQRVAQERGAHLVWVGRTSEGYLDLADLATKLSARTKVVVVEHISNVLGTITPLSAVVKLAHQVGACVVVDAAQSSSYLPLNMHELDIDYAAFSGHKAYGPSGTGWLYAKSVHLQNSEPLLLGGGMVETVGEMSATWLPAPLRFEAGTPNVAGVVGLGAAITYIESLGYEWIQAHEQALTTSLLTMLAHEPGITIIGPATERDRRGIVAFTLEVQGQPVHSHDIASIVNSQGVAIRAGHHCAQPLLQYLKLPEVARASVGVYTTMADIERLQAALQVVRQTLVS